MEFTRLNAKEYGDYANHCMVKINASFQKMVSILGEPHKNGEKDFPDDDYKVDVCWGLKSPRDEHITIWNYKDGPAYNKEGRIEDIDYFSVWYSDLKFFEELKQALAESL